MEDTLQQWFVREVIVHEPALMRYILRAWPDHCEAADIRQEVYSRVYEAAAAARPSTPRAFLFTSARNLILDRVRRAKIISIEVRGDLDELHVLIDEISPERRVSARQEIGCLIEAFATLPGPCREVIWKRKVEELSQKEVAAIMGTKERVVARRLSRGIRLLAESFFGARSTAKSIDDESEYSEDESEHGQPR